MNPYLSTAGSEFLTAPLHLQKRLKKDRLSLGKGGPDHYFVRGLSYDSVVGTDTGKLRRSCEAVEDFLTGYA